MDNKTYLLTLLLDCGTLDLDKLDEIIETCEDFDDDAVYNAFEDLKDNDIVIDCNSLISTLLLDLQNNLLCILTDEGIEANEDDFDIFVNALDSHITYNGKDKKVTQWLSDNCDLVEF